MQSEDSDSMGNNSSSMASSTGGPAGIGCVSSTEDGENSLASFDGLINGIPSMEQHDTIMLLNDSSNDSDTDDTTTGGRHVVIKKPLMLADLLEKKVDRDPPIINGILSKELRIGDKGLQLVENHIDKVLGSADVPLIQGGPIIDQVDGASDDKPEPPKSSKKRPAAEDQQSSEMQQPKKLQRIGIIAQSPPLNDNSSNSNDNDDLHSSNSGTVSTAAAKLFADFAADILEDEDEDYENDGIIPAAPPRGNQQKPAAEQEEQAPTTTKTLQQAAAQQRQQIIVSQSSGAAQTSNVMSGGGGMILASGTQLKTSLGQTVIVQNSQQVVSRSPVQAQSSQQQVIMQQGSSGQILLSQGGGGQLGQMQLVATGQPGGQPTQYVIQTTSGTGAQNFVVAQPQTTVLHGQQQTVLVAQTAQQVGKTIIILQPTQVQQMQQQMQQVQQHVQKVVMGPHGQQMVVTTPVTRTSTITTTQGTITLSAAPPPQNTSIIATTQTQLLTSQPTIMQTVSQANSNNIQLVQTSSKALQSATTNTSNNNQQGKTVAYNKVVSSNSAVVSSSPMTATSTSVVTSIAVKSVPIKKKAAVLQTAGKESLFICEWTNCRVETAFKSANQVFMHVCEEHCKETSSSETDELLCQWDRCDNMKRKRFSLMTHLQDKHCNLESMKASLIKRKQALNSGKSEPAVQSSPSQQHPGYAPDAAFHAIKRHALEFVNPKELQDDNEGPVTKSIRLTASLILRNLVIYSTNCRRFLKPYEPHLANVALSNVESSRTIAQVLYDMNDSPHHHHHTTSSNSR